MNASDRRPTGFNPPTPTPTSTPTPPSAFKPAARHGVGPSQVVLPPGTWPSVLAFLITRFATIDAATWQQRVAGGEVIDEHGLPITAQRPYQAGLRAYYYSAVAQEPRIPFEAQVLFQNEHLLVVDKPHFLPVMPSGRYLQETLLVRLKRQLGLDDLVPLHRLDRDTAGLVLFSIQPATRNAYSALFRERLVHKTYEAIAPWRAELALPLTRQSRIEEAGHFMLQHEVSGPVNATTHIALLERLGEQARYQLTPVSGQRHQLRVHMASLGVPIAGDGLYPVLTPEGEVNYARPLQLLARQLRFTDPVSGAPQCFESQRRLLWPPLDKPDQD